MLKSVSTFIDLAILLVDPGAIDCAFKSMQSKLESQELEDIKLLVTRLLQVSYQVKHSHSSQSDQPSTQTFSTFSTRDLVIK
jgi:hypothetical protein